MFLRPVSRSVPRSLRRNAVRNLSKKSIPSVKIIPSCPSPTCACSETPEMPEGFPIDHIKPLNGTMAAYAEQVIICTGRDDWESRIEDENGGDNMAARIKKLVGPKGEFHDPYYPISILNSSLDSTKWTDEKNVPNTGSSHRGGTTATTNNHQSKSVSAYLFPSFKYIPSLTTDDNAPHDHENHTSSDAQLREFTQAYLRSDAEPSNNQIQLEPASHTVKDVLVFICGHGGRDIRCGILGPVLREEFRHVLANNGIGIQATIGASNAHGDTNNKTSSGTIPRPAERLPEAGSEGMEEEVGSLARVGLISHVGGHKFAGNVIVYLPPGMKIGEQSHPLAGCGIWYGRVEPKHVEGIVQETILRGQVIKDMFRGGIRQGGEIMRI